MNRSFREELSALINRYSMESGSNTPDFMLAEYIVNSLTHLDRVITARDNWYAARPIPRPIPRPASRDKAWPTPPSGARVCSTRGCYICGGPKDEPDPNQENLDFGPKPPPADTL